MVASAQGLDVADWQGRYDWAAAKRTIPGLAFGIYRLTQGLGTSGTASPDPDAAWNHAQITAQGLHRGAYHFLDPRESGAAQAQYFVTEHARLGTVAADMFWLDNETAGANPAATAACAVAFMAELDQLIPHNPRGVYTFISFAKEGNCSGLGRYPLWLAYPATAAPPAPAPWATWTFWQYGQRGVDADAFNGTAAQLDAWIASYAAPPRPPGPPPATPPFPYPATDYMAVTSTDPHCHSGFYPADRPHVRAWQQQMAHRGWAVPVTGWFDATCDQACRLFQGEKGLGADGKVGPVTWTAAWTAPVT